MIWTGSAVLPIGPWCLPLRIVEPRARFLQLLRVDVALTVLDAAIGEPRLVEASLILLVGAVV
jgi:hypothetical protein